MGDILFSNIMRSFIIIRLNLVWSDLFYLSKLITNIAIQNKQIITLFSLIVEGGAANADGITALNDTFPIGYL